MRGSPAERSVGWKVATEGGPAKTGRSKTQAAIRWLQSQAQARRPEREPEARLLERIAALRFKVKLTATEVKAASADFTTDAPTDQCVS